jgi:hypothetical protein
MRIALVLALASSTASAHGVTPNVVTIDFQRGNGQEIAAGLDFGLALSHDGGVTWEWLCEDALHISGTAFYPDYAYTRAGHLFLPTFDGLRILRNQCSIEPLSIAIDSMHFASRTAIGPDDALYVSVTSNDGTNGIARSTDDGLTFPQMASRGQPGDWWESLETAPSDAQRLYLSGYRVDPTTLTKTYLLFVSTDAGASFQPRSVSSFVISQSSALQIAGVSPLDASVVYARVTIPNGVLGDDLYRSLDGGQTWTRILSKPDSLNAFVARGNGDIIAATPTLGAWLSHDRGDSWIALPSPPHLRCLVENEAGEIWGCTQAFGNMQIPADGYAIEKTTDLATWTPVLKFQTALVPQQCAVGTIQHDVCETEQWCGIVQFVGITTPPAAICNIGGDTSGGDVTQPPTHSGCGCNQGGGTAGLLAAALVAMWCWPRREKR